MSEILTIIQIIIYIGSLVSIYWLLKSDVRLLQQKIADIEKDREKKWKSYDAYKDRNCEKLNEVIGGIREIKNDIKWIKNKK